MLTDPIPPPPPRPHSNTIPDLTISRNHQHQPLGQKAAPAMAIEIARIPVPNQLSSFASYSHLECHFTNGNNSLILPVRSLTAGLIETSRLPNMIPNETEIMTCAVWTVAASAQIKCWMTHNICILNHQLPLH